MCEQRARRRFFLWLPETDISVVRLVFPLKGTQKGRVPGKRTDPCSWPMKEQPKRHPCVPCAHEAHQHQPKVALLAKGCQKIWPKLEFPNSDNSFPAAESRISKMNRIARITLQDPPNSADDSEIFSAHFHLGVNRFFGPHGFRFSFRFSL